MPTEQKQNSGGLKDQLNILLHEALMPIKDLLGEKKYTNRIRKAVKLITEGLEKKKKHSGRDEKEPKKTGLKEQAASAAPVAKKSVKKAAPAAKKAVVKKAAPVKKAVAAKAAPAKKAPARQAGKSR